MPHPNPNYLTPLQVAQAAQTAGFQGVDLVLAVAYAGIESAYDANAISVTGCQGLWQICGTQVAGDPYDPVTNARMAYAKWAGAGGTFSKDWTPYDGGPSNPDWGLRYAQGVQAVAQLTGQTYNSGPPSAGSINTLDTTLTSQPSSAVSGCVHCAQFDLGALGGQHAVCFDGLIAIAGFAAGGALLFGGIAVLVSFALKGTKAGAQALEAGGMLLGPAGKVATSAAASQQRQEAQQKEQQRQQATAAKQAKRDAQQQADAEHKARMQRASLRASRARARTAESRAGTRKRSTGNVAASARAKAREGRFSDFTPEEVRYAQRNQEELFK